MFGKAKKLKQKKPKKPNKTQIMMLETAKNNAAEELKQSTWGMYHNFKKHHGMLNW